LIHAVQKVGRLGNEHIILYGIITGTINQGLFHRIS
jgi:hypothetical protein